MQLQKLIRSNEPCPNRRFATELEGRNGDSGGISGIGLILVILESSNCFCGVSQVKIFVTPNS